MVLLVAGVQDCEATAKFSTRRRRLRIEWSKT
jgi:hypothetical protein